MRNLVADHSVWKMIRKLKSLRKILPPIQGVHSVAYTDKEKAQAFADSLVLQCNSSLDRADLDFIQKVEDFVKKNLEDVEGTAIIEPTSPSEIRGIIR